MLYSVNCICLCISFKHLVSCSFCKVYLVQIYNRSIV